MEHKATVLVPAVRRRCVDILPQLNVAGEALLVRGDDVDSLRQERGVCGGDGLGGGVVDKHHGAGSGGEEVEGVVGVGQRGGGGSGEVVGPAGKVKGAVVARDKGRRGARDEDGGDGGGGVARGVPGELGNEGFADSADT